MKIHQTLLTAACAAALAAPALSFASSEFHPATGEIGYTHHPDHVKASSVTRDQVLAEVQAARQEGWFALSQRSGIFPVKNAGPAKTRDQVVNELRTEPAAERLARMRLIAGG